MPASTDDRLFGWYLHTALAGPFGAQLTALVRRFVAQLNRPARDPEGEGFVDLDRVA